MGADKRADGSDRPHLRLTEWLATGWPVHAGAYTRILDVALVLSAVAAVVMRSVVVWFHVIFLLLAVVALMMPFRRFVIRLVLGMSVCSALVIWAVVSLSTPSDELAELPLLTIVLIVIFLVAQSRARVAHDRELAYQSLNLRADLELEGLRHQLEQSQRLDLLGRASTGLAHDLRNIFVVIRGCSAEPDAQSESELRASLTDVRGATDRAMGMLDDLLWLGREHLPEPAVTELRASILQVRPLLSRLTTKQTQIEVIADEPLRARIDRISMTQILMNLVANSADSISGRGRISVRACGVTAQRPGETTERYAEITVSDNGKGFDRAAIERAFESGFTTKGSDHSGLGLATVWQIVDRCGGSVGIESSLSRGTTVAIRLPLAGENAGGTVRSDPSEAVTASDDGPDAVLSENTAARGDRHTSVGDRDVDS